MDEWLVEDSEVGIRRDLSFSNWCSDDGAQATSSGRLSFDSSSSGADSEATGGNPQPAASWQLAFETEAQLYARVAEQTKDSAQAARRSRRRWQLRGKRAAPPLAPEAEVKAALPCAEAEQAHGFDLRAFIYGTGKRTPRT